MEKTLANFSRLSDQECGLLLQGHLLETLEVEDPTYLEWEVMNKFISVDYSARESLIRLLNFYLKKNTQNIGGMPVNVWLKRYLDKQRRTPREPNTFLEYSMNNPEIQRLNEKDQIRLMRIFRLYDYFLIEPIVDLDDTAVEYIMKFPMYLSQSLQEIKAEMLPALGKKAATSTKKLEKYTIKQAIQQYPKIGEQGITSSPLKIKSFDRPVRPSIKNWLYDYTSILGQGAHDSIQRTNYLFRSENAKNLSSSERDKLGIILKSFDENTPLPIDTENNEVVFENLGTQNAERRTSIPSQSHAQESFIRAYPKVVPRPTSPLKPVENSFIRPYPPVSRPAGNAADRSAAPAKPPTLPRPIQKNIPNSRKAIQFVNPFPAPESHEVAGEAPVKLKGFSEGISRDNQGSVPPVSSKVQPANQGSTSPPRRNVGVPQNQALAPTEPLKPYAPSRPKNIFYPHYGPQREEKPEPRVEGNIVDLSGDE
ncbi:MAG: hypothetical protein UX02_C0001G0204 [Candidatus Moranbacteria bacterium GW2011_GWC1_45_18]|nr:MAG: hypothetical protein UT79_C0002G0193 [Candidatus Moranbacteria bacterium GW2011_GWC2_40_12]KKT32608.1 MAG: hypothetical protein UW19_C0018G0030 [Candidatus Moranbacteria bacterium GW2011_GWF2_44_10]KKT70443.1 MAG: hypothetical protein UW66_C0041G0006 [Candidatus Moranbacteria bacterium GW2011_GWF1_44_4]KKU00756.1 MAG: hypothetical protein UX02_C0001G0204 [Candidatus Moranbacteria bacterium GW2011_GWC1_45_18]